MLCIELIQNMDHLTKINSAAVTFVTPNTLQCTQAEVQYRIDMCSTTTGAHNKTQAIKVLKKLFLTVFKTTSKNRSDQQWLFEMYPAVLVDPLLLFLFVYYYSYWTQYGTCYGLLLLPVHIHF